MASTKRFYSVRSIGKKLTTPVEIVVDLYWSGRSVQQHGGGPAERLAVMLAVFGEQWKQPIEVGVFAAIPTESNQFPLRPGNWGGSRSGAPGGAVLSNAHGFADRFLAGLRGLLDSI